MRLVRVTGRSMEPTLREGDVLLLGRRAPRVGDVAVVRLPGDRPVAVKRLVHREADGGWWAERDNPAEGVDSWLVGAVRERDVTGVVVGRLWPRPGRLPPRAGGARAPGNPQG